MRHTVIDAPLTSFSIPMVGKCKIQRNDTQYSLSSKLEQMSYRDVGGVAWKASEALLLSLRNSSEACKAAIAIP